MARLIESTTPTETLEGHPIPPPPGLKDGLDALGEALEGIIDTLTDMKQDVDLLIEEQYRAEELA